MAPFDGSDPAEAAAAIVNELGLFSPTLAERERWLVLNKTDLIDDDTLAERRAAVLEKLAWEGPLYEISAITGDGTGKLCGDLMIQLEEYKAAEEAEPELAAAEGDLQSRMQLEARERIEKLRADAREEARAARLEGADEDDDDDFDVEVEYVP